MLVFKANLSTFPNRGVFIYHNYFFMDFPVIPGFVNTVPINFIWYEKQNKQYGHIPILQVT